MEDRWKQLEEMMRDRRSPLNLEILLDVMDALIMDMDFPELRKNKNVDFFLCKFKEVMSDIRELRVKLDDFELGRLIGKGGYGTVSLVKHKINQRVYALKTLSKVKMLNNWHSSLFWEERNIMTYARSHWIPQLFYSFQDDQNLYMVIEYIPGGSLHHLLSRHKISENWAKFYLAEVVLTVDNVHSLSFIHRDVKPENFLLDYEGHLKLADFGMAVKMGSDGLAQFQNVVGTTYYMAPELLQTQTQAEFYGKGVDWWAVGVLAYKMLVGSYPFYAETESETKQKIRDHKQTLRFPDDMDISAEAKSLISSLLTDCSNRLGCSGVSNIKKHTFFKNVQWTWNTIRSSVAPIVPVLSTDSDKCFGKLEMAQTEVFPPPSNFVGNHLPFVGFSFWKDGPFQSSCSTAEQGASFRREDTGLLRRQLQLQKEQLKEIQVKQDLVNKYRAVNGQLTKVTKDLEAERNAALQNLKLETSRRKQIEQQVGRLQNKCSSLEAEKVKLETDVKNTIEKNIQKRLLQSKLSQSEMELSKVKEDYKKLQEKYTSLLGTLRDKNSRETEMSAKFIELQQTLQQKTKALEALEEQKKKQSKTVKVKQTKVDVSKTNLKLQEKIVILEDRLEKEVAAHTVTKDKLEEINKYMKDSMRELEMKLRMESSSTSHLKDRLQKVELEKCKLNCQLQQALQNLSEMRLQKDRSSAKGYRRAEENIATLNNLQQKFDEEKAAHNITKKMLMEIQNSKEAMECNMKKLKLELQLHCSFNKKLMKMDIENSTMRYSATDADTERPPDEELAENLSTQEENQTENQTSADNRQSQILSSVHMGTNFDFVMDNPPETELEDWLYVSTETNTRPLWEKKYVVLTSSKLVIFSSVQDQPQLKLFMEMNTNELLQIRSIKQTELDCPASEISKTFLIFYSKKPYSKTKFSRDSPYVTVKYCLGHEFMTSFFHGPTDCAQCSSPLWDLLRPPRAMFCRRCNMTLHKWHVEKKNVTIKPCKAKKLLMMAQTREKQKEWVKFLNEKLSKNPLTREIQIRRPVSPWERVKP